MPSPAPLTDYPPSRKPAGVVIRLPRWGPRYYRPRQRPRVAAPRRPYEASEANPIAGGLIRAGVVLGAILGGLAIGEGATTNRLRPQLAEAQETVWAVIHQARQAECVAVARGSNLGSVISVAIYGAELAAWAPTLLTTEEAARCVPEPATRAPAETHWGDLDAP